MNKQTFKIKENERIPIPMVKSGGKVYVELDGLIAYLKTQTGILKATEAGEVVQTITKIFIRLKNENKKWTK